MQSPGLGVQIWPFLVGLATTAPNPIAAIRTFGADDAGRRDGVDHIAVSICTFQITNHKGEWPRPCEQPVIADGHCASHYALCDDALQFVSAKIASPSVKMYYIGLTSRPRARSHGAKNRVYDRVMLKQELGPAEAISLEKFLQEKCKSGDKQCILYLKYDPTLRDLPYRPSLGSLPTPLPIYSVYVACMV